MVDRFGKADQVGQHGSDQVSGRVAAQQVGADAGQAADGVELGQRRQTTMLESGVGLVQAAAGGGVQVPVEVVRGAGVAAVPVGGGVQGEGQRWGAVVQAAVGPAAQFPGGGGGQPVVGALPGRQAGAGAFDVQQRDPDRAVRQRLRPPAPGPVQVADRVWAGQPVGDRVGQGLGGPR